MAINDKRRQIASRAIGQSLGWLGPIESVKSNCRIAESIAHYDGWIVGIAGIVVYCLLLTFSVSFHLWINFVPRLPNLSWDPCLIFLSFSFLSLDVGSFEWQLSWVELSWYDKRAGNALERRKLKRNRNRKPATENAINLMRQIVASAFGEQPIKLYEFLTYGIIRYMYCMYSMLCSMAFVADVCMKMTKYFGICISWLLIHRHFRRIKWMVWVWECVGVIYISVLMSV